MLSVSTQQRVRTRVVRSLEVERIVRMGSETLSVPPQESTPSAFSGEHPVGLSQEGIPSEEVTSPLSVKEDSQQGSEVVRISWSALHGHKGPLPGAPSHAQAVG